MTVLKIQKNALIHNLHAMQKVLEKKLLIPVLEGNAYGLGDVEVAKILYADGIRMVAVSRIEEAERLALSLPKDLDVLLMMPYSTPEDARSIVRHGIIATIDSPDDALLLSGIARNTGARVRAHVKFDVGSSSSGFLPGEAVNAAKVIKSCDNIKICGAFSEVSTKKGFGFKKRVFAQYEAFCGALKTLRLEGVEFGFAHIANTKTMLRFPELRMDAVRCGTGLVGRLDMRNKWGLKPCYRLESTVTEVRWLPSGHAVSRSQSKKTGKAMRTGIVSVGTADGLFQNSIENKFLFNKKCCELGGKKIRMIGEAGYTSFLIDISDVDCNPGDTVSIQLDPAVIDSSIRREYV